MLYQRISFNWNYCQSQICFSILVYQVENAQHDELHLIKRTQFSIFCQIHSIQYSYNLEYVVELRNSDHLFVQFRVFFLPCSFLSITIEQAAEQCAYVREELPEVTSTTTTTKEDKLNFLSYEEKYERTKETMANSVSWINFPNLRHSNQHTYESICIFFSPVRT